MSNLCFHRRPAILVASLSLLAASALVGCRSTDDSSSESADATAASSSFAEGKQPTISPGAAATASAAKPSAAKPTAPRPRELDLSTYDLDPAYTLDHLGSDATPTWPAPAARRDRAPVTLRAAINGKDVVVWGYGDAATSALTFDIRFLDEAGVVRASQHQGQPIEAEAGAWFRVARVERSEWPRAQVQLAEATVGGKKWTPRQPFQRTEWRYGLPENAAKEEGDSGVGFAVVGRERVLASQLRFSSQSDQPGTVAGVVIVAIRNGGKQPLERVEFELGARAEGGVSEPAVGVWIPMLGDAPEPVIAPGAWSFVEVVVKGDPERLLAASEFTMKVTGVEKAK